MNDGCNVLISEPMHVLDTESHGMADELQCERPRWYLPYVWAILKTYYEEHGSTTCQWLEPIWMGGSGRNMLRPYDGTRIDVVGLSCYTWNWEVQRSIAQSVKLLHPDCLVVAGGPEPDYKDPLFFVRNPYIDAIAVKDGELTFTKILDRIAAGDRDLSGIPGLYLPSKFGPHRFTGAPEVPMSFTSSPYVRQSAYLESLVRGYPGMFDAVIETTRGCPYSCSFCDWGSNTTSKIRRFHIERVKADFDWLGSNDIERVFLVDANFGILPRDVEIAEMMNDVRKRHGGFPHYLFWNAAKNHPDRVIAIAKQFADSGMCVTHALSIQHTHKDVLAATERSNISADRQIEVVKALTKSWIPIEVQLILGIPGDNPAYWRACFGDLMEWGIHEDYNVMMYRLLPNAPASEPDFLTRWEVKWVDRVMYDLTVRDPTARRNLLDQIGRIVVGSSTFDLNDWVEMATHSVFVRALHNTGLTQKLAIYLRLTHAVPYLEFYEMILYDAALRPPLLGKLMAQVKSHYMDFLQNDLASDHMPVAGVPNFALAIQPEYWIYVQLCLQLDDFFEQITDSLQQGYPSHYHLRDLTLYQKELVITPCCDPTLGKTIRVTKDWIAYFATARGRNGSDTLSEPQEMNERIVRVSGRSAGEPTGSAGTFGYYSRNFDWYSGDVNGRWARWIEMVVLGRNSAAIKTFTDLSAT
jgi:putative methyltransferase